MAAFLNSALRATPSANASSRTRSPACARAAKTLPCKYFYDAEGSKLFDQICALPEYYPTRTELGILRAHAAEMAQCLGPETLLVEYGSGSSVKTRLLLDRLDASRGLRAGGHLARAPARDRRSRCASTTRSSRSLPVCADFTAPFALPQVARPAARRAVYFPGSTIGNFSEAGAIALMAGVARLVGPGGAFLVGVDLKKDPRVLERAYDDAAGVTAAFNLQPARAHEPRARRRLRPAPLPASRASGTRARAASRCTSSPRSSRSCTSTASRSTSRAARASAPSTRTSTRSTASRELARRAGLAVRRVWTDRAERFSVQYLEARS